MPASPVSLFPIEHLPFVEPGDDLASVLVDALRAQELALLAGDILIVAQKIVSKAEGRYVNLDEITPSPRAKEIALATGKDPKHVEVILSQSDSIIKLGPNIVIAAHKLGFVMANAGIDESNIGQEGPGKRLLLLPSDPDGSADALKRKLDAAFEVSVGVVICDSFGRPWRNGVVGVALGAAGLPALVNKIGEPDLFGRTLKMTEVAIADELAAAGSLLMGQAAEGIPAVLVRGFSVRAPQCNASALIRDRDKDLFR